MNALLERERELDVLMSATAEAARGSGALVFVHGEPGIGKTSLVRAYLSRLTPDTRTFVGACDDLITPRTLGPFHDAVRWRGGPLADALRGEGDRDRVFNAVIEELSHPSELTVLVVEDVHWADDATLDVLQFIARRIDALRALVVLTYRDADLRDDHPLRSLLGTAAGRSVRHIAVPRLSQDAVGVLSAATERDPEAVYAVTGGNAFFVTELLAAGGDTPVTVVDAVLARVRHLAPATQRALEQLSVVPTRVEHRLVEALVGQLDSLVEAEQRGILRVGREHVAFRHELARRAIEHSLPHARRVALNRTVTAALLDGPEPDLARVVHHAVQAGDIDTIVAFGHTAGRDAARAGSHQQALTHFEQVLLHEDRLPADELPVLLEEYAWELYNAHRFVEAARTANRSCSLFRALGDERRVGTALVTLSRHRWMSGDVEGAWAALDEATELLDRVGDLAARAQAHTYRGAVLALQEQVDEALPQLLHAQALAEEAGSDSLVALCLNYRGICAMERRQESEAIALQRESLARARLAHDSGRSPETRAYAGEHIARAYTNLAASLHIFERFDELEDVLAEALPYVLDHDFSSHYYNLEIRRCAMLISRGQLAAAETALRELDRAVDDPGVLGRYMLPMFARLLARRGDPDTEFVLERASVHADTGRVLGIVVDVALAAIEWAWLTGQPHRAAPRLVDVLSLLDPAVPWHRRMLGEVLRYAKRAGLADGQVFEGCPEPWASGLRGAWLGAATQFQALGNDYERALELAESGDASITADAIELLDRLGADGTAMMLRRRMRELGALRIPRRPTPATRANPVGLTDRQVDVLRLLREGLTNAEIADRLVLSVRTVDHHVAAILDKLQVPSRRSAAERAVELGIA